MAIAASFLAEMDTEFPTTRKLLSLIPDEKAEWRPHDRSFTIGELGLHIARLPSWITMTMASEEFDLSPLDGGSVAPPVTWESNAVLLELFDENEAAARAALEAADDAALRAPWTLKKGGEVLFTVPRAASVRGFVLNHLIHHRGQLSVNLRLLDVALPHIYGPTADTPW